MKQFNLEEYLANPSRKVVTRDGRAVTRILCTDAKSTFPFVVLIKKDNDKGEDVCSFTKNGNFCESTETSLDLFFAPEKHEGWVNVYKCKTGSCVLGIYPDKEHAEKWADTNCVATIKIEWEE